MNHFLESDTLKVKHLKGRKGKIRKISPAFAQGFRLGFASFADISQVHTNLSGHKIKISVPSGRVDEAWHKVGTFIKDASDKEVIRLEE